MQPCPCIHTAYDSISLRCCVHAALYSWETSDAPESKALMYLPCADRISHTQRGISSTSKSPTEQSRLCLVRLFDVHDDTNQNHGTQNKMFSVLTITIVRSDLSTCTNSSTYFFCTRIIADGHNPPRLYVVRHARNNGKNNKPASVCLLLTPRRHRPTVSGTYYK